ILSAIASSTAVLTPDEKELGVVLVDIGAGTTDIAVFVQGAMRHTASLPIAGDQVTSDIAHMLRTPTPEAEQIKVRYACALAQLAPASGEHQGARGRAPAAPADRRETDQGAERGRPPAAAPCPPKAGRDGAE